MQLFSIGLDKLNMDGTRQMDDGGNPIPTYDNTDILLFVFVHGRAFKTKPGGETTSQSSSRVT
jgi:hypothetical protein